ncbi:GH36-type glycosyl hydrolase domain-containing protein [Yoonia sp.]|uniref:GH36-type glycosyl hydrolase domain-containing protein n=1 Tax=Yoonia sp. TaxID=2212373 RepID=UPI003F6B2257
MTQTAAPSSPQYDRLQELAQRQVFTARSPVLVEIYRALPALDDWLAAARDACADPAPAHIRAADWLQDNDYHVARAMRRLSDDLPASYYRLLPALRDAHGAGKPRVYVLAQTLCDILHPQISFASLVDAVRDFQQSAELTNAELWALPSMLRLASIAQLVDAFAEMWPDLRPAFDLSHVDQSDPDPVARTARAITNLIAIHDIKWEDFVDRTSLIEATLCTDPAGIYPDMTFETRDRFRKAVERLARRSDLSERAVAQAAIAFARDHVDDAVQTHVGYWLVGDGLRALEAQVGYRADSGLALRRWLARYRGLLYAGGLISGVLAAMAVPLVYLLSHDATWLQLLVGAALSLLPATILSVWVVHWIITRLTRPEPLAELDLSESIPPDYPTAIVLPVILGAIAEVNQIAEKLEILRLANPDPALRFVVLSDPVDASVQTLPDDAKIVNALSGKVAELNQRYGSSGDDPFFLLHRPRIFAPTEGCWMARERKRGKLEDFNHLVLGEQTDAFSVVIGPQAVLRKLRFAITLDADTQMPPGSAARLIGIMAHPLNRPMLDPETRRVTRGHAIIQPRIEILPKLGKETHFAHLYGGDTAVDIYSRAVSDVYQDLFGTGIFVGKGIYDIAGLQTSIAGRIPENRILSHDLFEGLHARAALATNVVLYEDLPGTYPEFAHRQHRWMRGDWQLLPWLWHRVPSAQGRTATNELSALDRWKIADNLRRSLVPPALLLFFFGAWLALPGSALVWTFLAIAAPGSYLIGEVFAIATGGIRRGIAGRVIHQIKTQGGRWFFSIVFLVTDTHNALDAIGRTLWRMGVSGRKRLEWTSAAHAATVFSRVDIRTASWRLMWPSTALALALGFYLLARDPQDFWAAAPVLLLWLVAPEISVWSAGRRRFRSQSLTDAQRRFLVLVARRTWHFFETFVGPNDNWLPPDNYQHRDEDAIAHRTSPTNIGMFLVSALGARDMGFISTSDFLIRVRNTVETLGRVRTFRGHILNWYDTRTLEPLEPQYVSTVDSGNLAVSLIVLRQGCLELAAKASVGRACFGCLGTTLDLLAGAIRVLPDHDAPRLTQTEQAIRNLIDAAGQSPLVWQQTLAALDGPHWHALEELVRDAIAAAPQAPEADLKDVTVWLDRYHHDLHRIARDIDTFMPWLPLLAEPPRGMAAFAADAAAALHPSDRPFDDQIAGGDVLTLLEARQSDVDRQDDSSRDWLQALRRAIEDGLAEQAAVRAGLIALAEEAEHIAYGMDFSFLYDPGVRLFRIGYNHSLGEMDHSHYDLLATEARLASYFAIAKHDAPIEHWFSFSRPVTRLQGKPSILSWNGSMFEYLMPPLFLPSYRDTLLGESELTAVDFQRAYARERGVPWGISESAFGATDAHGTYQYKAFGVPGLGIRRGLTEDLVIAPYSSALALCGWPEAAADNLARLAELGAMTRYGFYDALDYTPDRTTPVLPFVPVKTYMAHHQGMLLAAIVNATAGDVMIHRFLREKPAQAMDLLLQERVPWDVPLERGRADEAWERPAQTDTVPSLAPWVPSADFAVPQVHVLGNGRMASLVTGTGGGGLSQDGNALTRWRADPTRTSDGVWIYCRDSGTGHVWSLGAAPTDGDSPEVKCVFHQHMVELLRHHDGIVTRMDITVAPYDDVEIRRVTLINESDRDRTVDLTSYGEVVLAPALEDERHPAFSKLFVHSTWLAEDQALLFQRRPRRPETRPPVLLHKVVSDDPAVTFRAWDTDRAGFLGRDRAGALPKALTDGLGRRDGWTLDPIMALQTRVQLKPMQVTELSFLTITGQTRTDVLETASRYPATAVDRVFRDALIETGRMVQKLDIDPVHLPKLQVLSSLLSHFNHTLRGAPPDDGQTWGGQPELWRFGISGDLPILLLKARQTDDAFLLDLLIRAQRLWAAKGLEIDLVILRDAVSGYEEPLRERVLAIMRDTHADSVLGKRGGIHLLAADQIDADLRCGLEAAAHVVLRDDGTSLRETLDRALETHVMPPRFDSGAPLTADVIAPVSRPDNLMFDNGYGGFDPDSGDYVIHLSAGTHTPAPWCNVIANDDFGCLVSEAGFGATWAGNSGEHRLTPWSNDPVANIPSEVLYLRDEATGAVWTTTPAPLGHGEDCEIRHGAGETTWRQNSHGLEQELRAFVPVDAAVKLVRLRLTNRSGRARRVSATYYAEWILGALGSVSGPHVTSRFDPALEAIIGRNRWNPEFGSRAAFLTASVEAHSVSGDRHDFLGREGSIHAPEGLQRWDLGGRFTPGSDACAAYQVHFDIGPDQSAEVVFALGEVAEQRDLETAVSRWKDPAEADTAYQVLQGTWGKRLGSVQVKTPDPAFDLMVNRWLPYQNRACRIMARAGFYQAGGAYGFRDQLQDVLALLHSDPDRAREHILLAASYQFEAGDALHWWHPPEGRGVRTRCSDDYIWLAYVTARYVEATGDRDILNATVPFLKAPELRADEHDRYALFAHGEQASLYDHCARALDRMMTVGAHGLPLMGAGDWNDGMDRIGDEGQGESVWLAWFQIATIGLFAPLAETAGLAQDAARWRDHAKGLRRAIADHAWDGAWYLRAIDDAGVPWGSAENEECRIDLIAQAWSVLDTGPVDDRARKAIRSAADHLVDTEARLVRLLTPPFDRTDRDPGYIQAYPPGIRENGGQYTHAATWLGAAYVALGDGTKAHQVFDIIIPVRRAASKTAADHYMREPYVLAGDVSGAGERIGQGGWSWYTGAAGWSWQLAVAGILGIRPRNGEVSITPCLPDKWTQAHVTLDGPRGRIEIEIAGSGAAAQETARVTVDGKPWKKPTVSYPGKGKIRRVQVS